MNVQHFILLNVRPVGWGGSVGSDEPPHRGHRVPPGLAEAGKQGV